MWILTNYHTSLRSGFINRDIWLKRYLNCNKIRCDILTTVLIIIYDYGSIASMLLTVYIFITQLLLCLCVYARVSLIIRFIFVNPLVMPYRLKITRILLLKNIWTSSYFCKVQFDYKIMKRSTQRDSSFRYYYTCASWNIME